MATSQSLVLVHAMDSRIRNLRQICVSPQQGDSESTLVPRTSPESRLHQLRELTTFGEAHGPHYQAVDYPQKLGGSARRDLADTKATKTARIKQSFARHRQTN